MKNARLWIALQNIFGYASHKASVILDEEISIVKLFEMSERQIRRTAGLSREDAAKLKKADISQADIILEKCQQLGITVLTPDDAEYPQKLLKIYKPPLALYIKGKLPELDDRPVIAMVGTRKCTFEGKVAATTLAYRFSKAGALVVSGGALGIDARCSCGAIDANAPSIMVLGSGLDNEYPKTNISVRERVIKNGAVISEYQPGVEPHSYNFPERNRIMAGLSDGVVVVEAPEKSGSLITVNHAAEQGKDVFALTADISDKHYAGNRKLLLEGAIPVYTAADVLSEYTCYYPNKLNLDDCYEPISEDEYYKFVERKYIDHADKLYLYKNNIFSKPIQSKPAARNAAKPTLIKDKPPEILREKPDIGELEKTFDENTVKVYKSFTQNEMLIDKLIESSELPAAIVSQALVELEIGGYIKAGNGARYSIIE